MMPKSTWFDTSIEHALITHESPEDELGYYVYQLDTLKTHLATLQQQDVIKLWFAVKANPLSKIIQTLD